MLKFILGVFFAREKLAKANKHKNEEVNIHEYGEKYESSTNRKS